MKMEIAEIKEQFKRVLEYSQGINNPHIDKLFDTFMEKKAYFIDQFGGFIKEIPNVVFNLDQETKEERVNDFLNRIERKYKCYDLSEFISSNIDGFYKNEVIYSQRYKGEEIPKGMKLLKAFKFFVPEKAILTDIQNEASRVIQEDKIEGTLCFSVHPLDFLSVSENTHNWRSCHALDGEYRGGNLSYMMDDSTFICYLRSNGYDYQLPNFPEDVKWNSKKWRVLLYLSNDHTMLMAGRQYPFSSSTGMSRVLNELFVPSLLEESLWWQPECSWSSWQDDYTKSIMINSHKYHLHQAYPIAGRLKTKEDFIIDMPHSLQFNDLLNSSYYQPMYSYLISAGMAEFNQGYTNNDTCFHIGGEVPCLACGGSYIYSPETLVCESCFPEYDPENEEGWYCDCCDCWINDSEGGYEVDGDYICGDCLNSEAEWCEGCHSWHYIENMHCIEKNCEITWYCKECWEEMEEDG